MDNKLFVSSSFKKFLDNSVCAISDVLHGWISDPEYYAKKQDLYTVANINYLTFRKNGLISYLPAGKPHQINEDGDWSKEGRLEGKPGKVVRKLFTKKGLETLTDKDFEQFANHYKAECDKSEVKFKLRHRKFIPQIYDMEVGAGGGTLATSCMNGEARFMQIYVNCPVLSILTLVNAAKQLVGRALIWKLKDNQGKKITLMDRIYVCEDHMYQLFFAYAKEKGWWRKYKYNSRDDTTKFVDPEGLTQNREFTVETQTEFEYYPYIDTFSWGNDGYLYNHEYAYPAYTYDDTEGSRSYNNCDEDDEGDDEWDEHEGESWDYINEEYISDDEAVVIDCGSHSGRITHIDNTVIVDGERYWEESDLIVQVDGVWYRKDDYDSIRYIDSMDDYALAEDCVFSEYDTEDYLAEDCVYSEYHNSYILKEDSVKGVDGNYYHKDDKGIEIEENDPNQIKIEFNPYVSNRRELLGLYKASQESYTFIFIPIDHNSNSTSNESGQTI